MKPRFKKLYVEVTSVCNLHCSFCPPTGRSDRFMTVDEFRRVATQIATLTGHVHFHVKGEPLLHPQLEALLDQAHAVGLKVHIVTNGTRIGGLAELLLRHPALHKINFSLHSWEASGDEGLEAYLEPILAFTRRAEATDRILTVLRFWTEPNPALLGRIEAHFPREGNRLGQNTFLDFAPEFAWPQRDPHHQEASGFCLGWRDQAAVLVDGTVVPCCLDGEGVIDLGNLFVQDFSQILEGDRARALYHGFSEHRAVEPLCQACRFKDRFQPRVTAPGASGP